MLSFISADYKKLVKREYLARFVAVLCIVIAILGFIASLLLIPYIVFVKSQEATSEQKLSFLANSSQTKDAQAFRADLNTLNSAASRLAAPKDVMPYEVVTELTSLITPGIHLSSVSYGLNSDGSANLTLGAVADSREALQAFVAGLQAAPGFTGVNVPVSAFAQDKDINFSLSMSVLYEKPN